MTEQMELIHVEKVEAPDLAGQFFHAPQVVFANPFAALPEDKKLRLWAECVEEWLASKGAATTRNAYRAALSGFMATLAVPIWRASPSDVEKWQVAMREAGSSDATIALKVAAVSSLYRYAMEIKTYALPDGSRRGIADFNPAKAIGRPKVEPYGKAAFLTKEQQKRLLRAIPRHTLTGMMHYALVLCYITTGRRNSEIRRLRWGDIEEVEGKVFYTYSNKGKKDQKYEFPRHAWEAIVDYLVAAGRFTEMRPEDYIFTALTDHATRFKRQMVSGGELVMEPVMAEGWRPGGEPLSLHETGRIVKMYAKRVGIKKIKVHHLRHTFAENQIEAGADVQSLQKKMGHSNIGTTSIYIDHRQGHVIDEEYDVIAGQLGLDQLMRERRGIGSTEALKK